jgi:hypothetical protein
MFDWKLILNLIGGKPPPARVVVARNDNLSEAAGTRGTLVLGDPGTGKSVWVATQIYKQWKKYHEGTYVFDWSGPMTNIILDLISRDKDYEKELEMVVLDELGNDSFVVAKPEFHPSYSLTDEEQVARVVENMHNLASFLMPSAPFLTGISIEELGKNLFRLLMAIRNEAGETWQLTEAMDLITDTALLARACNRFGQYAMPAKKYFEKQFLPDKVMPAREKELTTRALRFLLGKLDGREVRANVGYHTPSYTDREVDEKGLLVLVDSHKMINQPAAQHYLITQRWSQILAWINKRETDDPNLRMIRINLDETYPLLRVPGLAEQIGMIAPLYRSRRVALLIILQALWQLDDRLKEQVFTLGSVASFGISNGTEAETIARQLFKYSPTYVKHLPKTPYQNPTTEPSAGQDRLIADWIQNLKARQLIMRKYNTEQSKEEEILFIRKTTDYPTNPPNVPLRDIKDYLIKKRGVPIKEALKVISERNLETKKDMSRPTVG